MRHTLLAVWFAIFCLLLPTGTWAKATVLSAKTEQCADTDTPYTPIQQRYERGIFFRILRCGYPASYMMGTMHSDSPRLVGVYNDATALIKNLQSVGFEFVDDANTAVVAAQYMYFPSSSPAGLSSMISAVQFDLLAQALETRLKLPRHAADRLRPWAAAITLQYPPPVADGVVLDKRLQLYAQSMQKNLFGLETPAEQFRIFDGIPLEKQLLMLQDTIESIAEIDASNEEFMQAFINRDLNSLHQQAEASFAMISDNELREYIEENLLYKRNRLMAGRMQPHLKKGEIMVAIGALHLMGEKGVLAHLEAQGWRIEVVHP